MIAQRLPECLAQADADVFDRVMLIDVQVADRFNRQVEHGVFRQEREHVIQKTHARGNLGISRAVEIQFQLDLGFRRFALNGCGACHLIRCFFDCF